LPSCFKLTCQHRHQRIVTQFVVVVQILVAKREPEHPIAAQIVGDHHTSLLVPRTSVHTPRSSSDVGRCSFRGEILKLTSGAKVHQTFTMLEYNQITFFGG
jgi:hypothetical protein